MIEYSYMNYERPTQKSLDTILASLDGSVKKEKFSITVQNKLCDVFKEDSTSWTVYIEDRVLAVTLHADGIYRTLDHTTGDNADLQTQTRLFPLAIEAVRLSISNPITH